MNLRELQKTCSTKNAPLMKHVVVAAAAVVVVAVVASYSLLATQSGVCTKCDQINSGEKKRNTNFEQQFFSLKFQVISNLTFS